MSVPVTGEESALVQRSEVPTDVQTYGDYKRYLRHDFYYSCAYCTICESEAQTIGFEIDHYEPKATSPHLELVYGNLMYACGVCNQRKGDFFPPLEAQNAGIRYFRPDKDLFTQHFKQKVTLRGVELEALTPIGDFSIEYIDLNRQALLRLRELRAKVDECERFVAHGVLQLRSIKIDALPANVKAQAARLIDEGLRILDSSADAIDDLLRSFAHSPLADEDPDAPRREEERRRSRAELKGLFPGLWRKPRPKRKRAR